MKAPSEPSSSLPPWKLELLSRGNALSRALGPKLETDSKVSKPKESSKKILTSWREVVDGAQISPNAADSNEKRPLSAERWTARNKTLAGGLALAGGHVGEEALQSRGGVGITCATLSGVTTSKRSGSALCLNEEKGASSSSTSTSRSSPLSPCSGWPAHRPSRLTNSSTSGALEATAGNSSVVTPTPPFNREQSRFDFENCGDDLKKGNALSAKRVRLLVDDQAGSRLDSIGRGSGPPFVRKPPASQKMGEDNYNHDVHVLDDGIADSHQIDSDSSEEIHYGPGFVSKLKSRYMSAALRSSSSAANGGLRRTTSLEDFLDKDKEEDSIELQPKIVQNRGRFQQRKVSNDRRSNGVASQVSRKSRESIKRCQSVEVLARNKIPEKALVQEPPPLPPKKPIENVLNSEALANPKIELMEKNHATTATKSTRKAEASSTVIASLRRPFAYRRRSAGLLFGVEEKELPAPDTVKETRKIFETKSSHSRPAGLIKSRSTSNLYGNTSSKPVAPPPQRQKSYEAPPPPLQPPAVSSRKPTKKDLDPKLVKPAIPAKPELSKTKFEVPPLRQAITSNSTPQNGAIDVEEGIKIVSKDSIDKIRQAGVSESFSFNFKTPEPSKPYLPQKQAQKSKKVDTMASADNGIHTAVPVGVIKPITRVKPPEIPRSNKVELGPVSPPPPTSNKIDKRAESPTTTLNNLINLTKQSKPPQQQRAPPLSTPSSAVDKENSEKIEQKEVILIDKKHDLEPILKIPKPKETQRVYGSGTHSQNNHSKIVTFADDVVVKTDNSDPIPLTKDNFDEGIDNSDELDMNDPSGLKSNYRDSWKKRQEAETKNTMVFNFLNSQKDVTHIENDGLDLSKRKKKQRLQQMAKVRLVWN